MSVHTPAQKRRHEESAPQNAGPGKSVQAAGVGLPLFMQANPTANAGVTLQRKCACSGSPGANDECATCKSGKPLQAKLAIGASDDPLEQEADRVADQVLAMPAKSTVSAAPPSIQRYTGQATGETDTVPTSVERVLAGSGRPLEPALQQDMEQRFGHDFSRVRVYSSGVAEQSAQDVNAHAYTVGHDIVFGAGRFAPGTHDGRRLIAHELTHVVQQSGADGMNVSQSNDKRGLSPIAPRALQRDAKGDMARVPELSAGWELQIIEALDTDDDADFKWIAIQGILLNASSEDYAALYARVSQAEPPKSDRLTIKFRKTFTGRLRNQIFKRLTEAAGGAEVIHDAPALEAGWAQQVLEALATAETAEFKWIEIQGVLLNAEPETYAALYSRVARYHIPKDDKLAKTFNKTFQGALRWQILARLMEVGFAYKPQKPDPYANLPPDVAPGRQSKELKEFGRVDAPKGAYLRNRPGTKEEEILLPFDTLVWTQSATVEKKGQQRWFYVVALGDSKDGANVTGTGFIEEFNIARHPPEPTAHLHLVQPGQVLKDIAAVAYKTKLEGEDKAKFHGHDARVFVQAIYHANKTRDVVFRQKLDLTVNREALETDDFEKAQKLWNQARVLKGQALWVPSTQFVQKLYSSGLIHHASITQELWDMTIGAVGALIDWAQYTAGFVIGLLGGAWDALKDLIAGVWDLIKAVGSVIKAIFTDWDSIKAFGAQLALMWENRSELLEAIATNFDKKWNSPDDYDRGKFQGDVLGYIMMTAFLLLVSMGTFTPVVATGRLANFIKLIQFLDKAGDITTYASKLRRGVKLSAKVVDELTDHVKPKVIVETAGKAAPDLPPAPSVPDVPPVKPPVQSAVDAPVVGVAPKVPDTKPAVIDQTPVPTNQPGVYKRPKADGQPKAARVGESPHGSSDQDIEDVYKQETEYEGSGASDFDGYTSAERTKRAEDLVDAGIGAVQGMEEHHWVFVFFVRAIEMKRAGRKVRTITKDSTEGFRAVVDEVFKQKLSALPKLKHKDLHRALDDVLDEMLEPERAAKLAERNRVKPAKRPKSFGTGSQLVSKGGVKAMMARLKTMTPMEVIDLLEEAYMRVYRDHPGLLSEQDLKALLDAFDVVRKTLRERA